MNRQTIIENIRAKRDEVRQLFTDAAHWNEHVRKPHEPEINPDPDGSMREIERAYTATLEREDAKAAESALPESAEEITEFIRAVDAGEIECPPAPNAKLVARLCVQSTQIENLARALQSAINRLDTIRETHGHEIALDRDLENLRMWLPQTDAPTCES